MESKYKYIRRLKALRKFIQSVPPRFFNLNAWAEINKPEVVQDLLNDYGNIPIVHRTFNIAKSCGMVGCIGGWGVSMPSFRRWVMANHPQASDSERSLPEQNYL